MTPAPGERPRDTVRVSLAGATSPGEPRPIVVSVVAERVAAETPTVLVDGVPARLRLVPIDAHRATLVEAGPAGEDRHPVVFPGEPVSGRDGVSRREVVVDGWRVEVELEPERRARLRERARRGGERAAGAGPTEVRAVIPGRVVSVHVAAGDAVSVGQQLLVVEAMKMQNELRAPRDGAVRSVAVGAGATIEVGDLLLVIE